MEDEDTFQIQLMLAKSMSQDSLFTLASSSSMGYLVACQLETFWEALCADLGLCRSQYDSYWLDTFARAVRQCVFRSHSPFPWIHAPKLLVDGLIIQKRTQMGSEQHAENIVVWRPDGCPTPWFVLADYDKVYTFFQRDGGFTKPPPTDLIETIKRQAKKTVKLFQISTNKTARGKTTMAHKTIPSSLEKVGKTQLADEKTSRWGSA
jgi:hypothetical protein